MNQRRVLQRMPWTEWLIPAQRSFQPTNQVSRMPLSSVLEAKDALCKTSDVLQAHSLG